jgi:hypothetical protein
LCSIIGKADNWIFSALLQGHPSAKPHTLFADAIIEYPEKLNTVEKATRKWWDDGCPN